MSLLSWLPAKRAIPEPRGLVSQSRSTPSRVVPLPLEGPRWHTAVVHLEDTLSAWSLPTQLARRWLQPARDIFTLDVELELFVQLDPVGRMVSVELWDDEGAQLFGSESSLEGMYGARAV